MEDGTTTVELLLEKAEQYGKTSAELFKLKAIDKTADVGSSLTSGLIIITLIGFSLFLISIGASIWIGEILGRYFYGFFIVSAFYLVAALIFYLFRKEWLKVPVSNSIIQQMLK